jgi:hypothetical protein
MGFAPTVKTVPFSHPYPVSSIDARREFGELERWLFSPESCETPLHQIEEELRRRLLEVGRLLLQEQILARGPGDTGPKLELLDSGRVESYKRGSVRERHQETVFGTVSVKRRPYQRLGSDSVFPLDAEMELPNRRFSYGVQRVVVKEAVKGPFDETIQDIGEYTGASISKRSAEKLVQEISESVDEFYAERRPPDRPTGPVLVAAVDCKEIPMKKDDKAEKKTRRKRGEKSNKKRMATIAAVHTAERFPRTPEEIVDNLFRDEKPRAVQRQRPKPENKRVYGSLKQTKDEFFVALKSELESRDPTKEKDRVALVDGERALQKRVKKWLPGFTLIIDIIHVLESLWKVAYCFLPEGTPEAKEWVKARLLKLLQGKVSSVVRGIRQSATKRNLKGKRRKVVDQVTAYLYNNRAYMRYDVYLERGFPIGTGTVEGACKNLVKDRMERSGMRWTEDMAEAMLKLRGVYLSGDFERFWTFHIRREQKRLYPQVWVSDGK